MKKESNKFNIFKTIGVSIMPILSIATLINATLAWQMAQSKATIAGRDAIIRSTTAMTLGLRYFTGNGTLGGTYEGYDSVSISTKTINYNDDPENASDLFFAPLTTDGQVTNAFNFSAMRPGKNYSFAFEETGKDEFSILISSFAPEAQESYPYKEMYTGPLAIANDIFMNTDSWLRIHDLSLDDAVSENSNYRFMGYNRFRSSDANVTLSGIAEVASGTNSHQKGSFKPTTAGNNKYDIVLFGDLTIGIYAYDQSYYVASNTAASTYKLYGYSNPAGMTTSSGADETTSRFYYVNDATIAKWNTSANDTKYITSASAVVGYSQGFSLSATASTNNSNAAAYIEDTVDGSLVGSLVDKIDYRLDADIEDGLASGNTSAVAGDSTAQYELGTTSGDELGTSQIVFVTFSFSKDNSDKLKVICKRGDGATEKIFYAYHPSGSFEPYFGFEAGFGSITLS